MTSILFSPGYMLTKLTRTILSHDPDLKVLSPASCVVCMYWLLYARIENMGELNSYGTGTHDTRCAGFACLHILLRWVNPRTWKYVWFFPPYAYFSDLLKGAIVLLASDASRFMTGSDLRIDGGYCVIWSIRTNNNMHQRWRAALNCWSGKYQEPEHHGALSRPALHASTCRSNPSHHICHRVQ